MKWSGRQKRHEGSVRAWDGVGGGEHRVGSSETQTSDRGEWEAGRSEPPAKISNELQNAAITETKRAPIAERIDMCVYFFFFFQARGVAVLRFRFLVWPICGAQTCTRYALSFFYN